MHLYVCVCARLCSFDTKFSTSLYTCQAYQTLKILIPETTNGLQNQIRISKKTDGYVGFNADVQTSAKREVFFFDHQNPKDIKKKDSCLSTYNFPTLIAPVDENNLKSNRFFSF